MDKEIRTMSDEEWQKKFELMKLYVKPVSDKKLTRHAREAYILGRNWCLTDNEQYDTLDKRYVNYINDVLKQIRSKKVDYCYYYYQIMDLLKFEPNLKTKLVHEDSNTYFEVWIDKV